MDFHTLMGLDISGRWVFEVDVTRGSVGISSSVGTYLLESKKLIEF